MNLKKNYKRLFHQRNYSVVLEEVIFCYLLSMHEVVAGFEQCPKYFSLFFHIDFVLVLQID